MKKQSVYRQRAKESHVKGAGVAGVITGVASCIFVVFLVLYIVLKFTKKD